MRLSRIPVTLCLGGLSVFLAPRPAAAEVTRTLRAELSGQDVSNFAVENLAGRMRIAPGPEGSVSAVATIHAETQALADAFRFERVSGEQGAAALRVRYPDGVSTIQYRAPGESDGGFSISIDLFSGNDVRYDGRPYRIAPRHGKRIWADLEVRVPARLARAQFRNLAGLLEAEGLEGTLQFEVSSADLRLERLAGDLSLEGSSGDIRAADIHGKWASHFSSGDCRLDRFEGEALDFRTSSGDIEARGVRVRRAAVHTSSGDATIQAAAIEEFAGESSSGDFELACDSAALRDVRAHTSSGNVAIRLPRDASFDAAADQSSGDMSVGFSDGTETRRHHRLVAYRRGDGATQIRVRTSSGDFEITPR